jgi:hypothetical protein
MKSSSQLKQEAKDILTSILKEELAVDNIKSKYLAFIVDPSSREMLLQKFPPKYPRVICGHITVEFNVNDANYASLKEAYEGAKANVIGYATDGQGVEALVVNVNGSTNRPSGGTFHITLSLAEGRKPVESNKIIQSNGFEPVSLIPINVVLSLLNK